MVSTLSYPGSSTTAICPPISNYWTEEMLFVFSSTICLACGQEEINCLRRSSLLWLIEIGKRLHNWFGLVVKTQRVTLACNTYRWYGICLRPGINDRESRLVGFKFKPLTSYNKKIWNKRLCLRTCKLNNGLQLRIRVTK